MADKTMFDALKQFFSQRITTSSRKERLSILSELHPILEKSDIPDASFKGIVKVLVFTIDRYHDSRSRNAVLKVLELLVISQPATTCKNVASALSDFAESCKSTPMSKGSAAAAMNALSWVCFLLRHSSTSSLSEEELTKLVSVQTLLVYGALSSTCATVNTGVQKRLNRLWRERRDSIEVWLKLVTAQEASVYVLPMISSMMSYLYTTKQTQLLDKQKDEFIQLYTKQVIGCKTTLARHIYRCCDDILRHCSHENMKSTILPAVEKAMLRNPEIVIEAVSEMLRGLKIELSSYALAFGKPLATQSGAKIDASREHAVRATGFLAKQCSESSAMEKLLKHYFGVLNGSEGKITVAPQRMSVVSAVAALSDNGLTGSSLQSLINMAVESYLGVLQQESHEGTLVLIVQGLTQWTQKLATAVSEKLTLWFKTAIGLKTSTSAVRNAYIQCMNSTYRGDTLSSSRPLLGLLLGTVEKAHAQSTQLPLVTEGLSASCLLTRLSRLDIQNDSQLEKLWPLILDMNKQMYLTDKFLTQASDEALMTLATLVSRLCLEHPQKFTATVAGPYYRGMIFALTHGSHTSRAHAHSEVQRMIATLGGVKITQELLREFRKFADTVNVKDLTQEGDKEGESGDKTSCQISPRLLASCLLSITVSRVVGQSDPSEAETVAMETLFDAHHPVIMLHNVDMWTDLVGKLGVDARSLVEANVGQVMSLVKNTRVLSEAYCNALGTLARIAPQSVVPGLMDIVMETLEKKSLVTVAKDDYGIMRTAEGELYDQTIIQSALQQESNTSTANLKRESKLYSYKEQLAEIELRKELEEKKGGAKKQELPKFTKKQQEQYDEQMKKEEQIRSTLQELERELCNMCDLLKAVGKCNPAALRQHFTALLRQLVVLMASPLASPHVTDLFMNMGGVAFTDVSQTEQFFVEALGACTLRLLSPACALDDRWTEEPLREQATRLVNAIHSRTVPPKGLSNFPQKVFIAPAFSYCFFLLKKVLENGGKVVGGNEAVMKKGLAVIYEHAQMRQDDTSDAQHDENGPELLPREAMLRLCATVLGNSSVGTQLAQLAQDTLVASARSASGGPGCTTAEQGEIDALLEYIQRPAAAVREAALQGLLELVDVLPSPDIDYDNGLNLARRIWVTRFDAEPTNKALAENVWQGAGLTVDPEMCSLLVQDTVHDEEAIRVSAAMALAEAIGQHNDHVDAVLIQLMDLYDIKLYIPPPVLDSLGRQISETPPDLWPARTGIAIAICKLAPLFEEDQIDPLFHFFVERSLGDRQEEVRRRMIEAAVATVNKHGKEHVNTLLPVLEGFLANAPTDQSYDAVRQGVVILMGSLAKHLSKEDPKVKPIVAKLINALSTPSAQVQQAVADCLPALVPAIKEEAEDMMKRLLDLLLESQNYGERRGAAYGIAGLVKGLGIVSLNQLKIVTKLTEALTNKKKQEYREGALFAFEMLCTMLGRMFEPYIVNILPHLLLCFGDQSSFVRQAADDCAKAVMSQLSSHGVKLVLPKLLEALNEDSWRTKTGSAELLGAMAFCAPKQLSDCLPSIVPKLTEVLTDSHLKVQKAGAQALRQIGSVIRNPEIQAIVPTLLEALQDPSSKTTPSLQCLLETKFVHFIDAPSLALIMPVVQRAFLDRSTETRKMAAQIIGNMYSLTDQKDLSPYLPNVIPGLKTSLLDPVPEVRAISAHALGTMVKGMGQSGFEELVPWLMKTLTSEQSTVDRSGAAQGLSEVIGGLGIEQLHKYMPDIMATAERRDIAPHVRDGYIMMYIYLPSVFRDDFLQYVGPIIPSILTALSDENEFVRDTALRAGQRIVNLYADTSVELLLPQLEAGLFDDNWRIRYSSVQLLGDMLYKVSGVSGKGSTESTGDDDNFGTETSQKAILKVLGEERRNRVLAGLYMGRSDIQLVVRQAALHVWKVVVSHTPKTLREILPTLFELLLSCLASSSYDKRQVAARTLGDIVKKLGEKVLPEIIPILEKGLASDDAAHRQGVCIGLSEIMASTSRDHVLVFVDSLIPTVQRALIDPLGEVRAAASQTFAQLHNNIGPRAVEEIIPKLLLRLDDPAVSEFALDGLQQVMVQRSNVVLPFLVPELTKPPVNTKALSLLSCVAGEALNKHLYKILPALLYSLSRELDTHNATTELGYCQAVVLSVTDDFGTRTVVTELLRATGEDESMRAAAITLLRAYCEQTKQDLTDYVPQLLRGVIHLFIYEDKAVLEPAGHCLSAIIKKLDGLQMLAHIGNLRQAIKFAASDLPAGKEELPGLCLPGMGISHILPVFREGVLNGPVELKEQATFGFGELTRRTSAVALKPSVLHITGPLIRVLGDRYPAFVKVAILETLSILLNKCGIALKSFLPQLQTTFLKALIDPERKVRLRSAEALGQLIGIHTRVDPLFTELLSGINSAAESGVRETTLQALRYCIVGAGEKMSDKMRTEALAQMTSLLTSQEDVTRTCAAACLGCLCAHLDDGELTSVLNGHLLDTDATIDWSLRHGRSIALSIALQQAAQKLLASQYGDRVQKAALAFTESDRVPISMAGLRSVGYILRYCVEQNLPLPKNLLVALAHSMKQESNDIKALGSQIVIYVSYNQQPESSKALESGCIRALVPMLVNGTKERNTLVKTNSDLGLISLLCMRQGDDTFQKALDILDAGMKDSLAELGSRLRKVAVQSELKDENIDDTQLVN